MNRFIPFAALAVAPLAGARFNRLAERHNAECCPCPASGYPNQPVTVTVTQQATAPAPQTVTVERVIPAPPAPVYVTQNNNNNNNNINNNNAGSQGPPPAATVVNYNGPQGGPPLGAPPPSVVTVTASPPAADPAGPSQPPAESPSRPREGPPAETKTVTVIPQPPAPPAPASVTAPTMRPQGTGKPLLSSRPCPPVVHSTRIATAYNTVSVVVGGPMMPYNNETSSSEMGAAQATGMMKRDGRKPRAPLSQRSL